ncbi:hypothetical protein BU23DRAFT_654452 [Bimuria novae-zelandiae CBS 107.79]|uniref:Uncharacterized protein n=1 Tax=Bimuria novae-zelandiae CBS 107.79 TaxID=1447943 RepID=A0A6A5VQY1_9PLEO|nr:hypothetical protein BU23DRAFT_654452 [Bimuria novae-zelandiae CBS 107.79]
MVSRSRSSPCPHRRNHVRGNSSLYSRSSSSSQSTRARHSEPVAAQTTRNPKSGSELSVSPDQAALFTLWRRTRTAPSSPPRLPAISLRKGFAEAVRPETEKQKIEGGKRDETVTTRSRVVERRGESVHRVREGDAKRRARRKDSLGKEGAKKQRGRGA